VQLNSLAFCLKFKYNANMKQLIVITLSTMAISFIAGCSSKTQVAPSQNSALNSISPSTKNKKAGYMQKSLDSWLKDEWTPTVSQDKKIQKKYMKKQVVSKTGENNETEEEISYVEDDNRTFTLQEYADKAKAYIDAKPNNYEKSYTKKVKSMPVIGE
jgi:DNA polymerase I-like protein with 3'-5' exonuclease and polymerase domains